MTATATATAAASTRWETLFMNLVWWDRYSISGRDRFASLLDATAAAMQQIADDIEDDCGGSYDCIRIWDRAEERITAEWQWGCDDAEPDGEGGMIGVGYGWHRIR